MSEVKVSNNPSIVKVEEDQSHSDSELSVEEPFPKAIKSEKKKPLSSNFGRPRKHPYKPGKYKCMYCETMCSKPSVLTKHLRAHTNERPFPCCICKRSFKTKSNLSKHEKSKSHSSRAGENHVERNQQSKREQAEMMLQQLTGIEPNTRDSTEPKNRIEFDSIEKKNSSVNSNYSSPLASDDKSFDSDEIGSDENMKKEKLAEPASLNIGTQSSEPAMESSSSCSGVLTINSNEGPITFEVQINLETMRHLQQGLSNINNKRNCSSPIPPLATRNDAELRAAESILHMANQRSCPPDKFIQKDDIKKNGPITRKIPRSLSPLNRKSPDIGLCSKPNNITKSSSIKDSNSNKSTPLEETDPSNFKIHTKCLVKENLLKKMKRKQVQETNILSRNESPIISVATSNNTGASNNKSFSERTTESVVTSADPRFSLNKHLSSEDFRKVISEMALKKHPNIYGKKPIPSLAKAHFLRSNSPTFLLLNTLNNPPKSLIPDSKSISPITIESVSESHTINLPVTHSHLEIDTVTLSKVITNTQSFHQHQENKSLQENVSIINSFPSSQIVTNFPCSEDKHEVKIENINNTGAVEYQTNEDEPNKVPYQKQISNQTTHESENELSPRLCIVEEPPVVESHVVDKKVSESDEEIDVVNTDSDDDTLQRQRTSEVTYSDLSSKKRKYPCDDDNELIHKDVKHIKEIEKCVPLHAPNINAKDLMQDCPLNLSANRQPTIPPVSQIPVSVLQNLYQTIAPSIVTSSNMSSNTNETDSIINTLTNQNPAHPQSFHTFPTTNTSSLPTNGHHRDYPIFEDKVLCEVCSQMIEPSMLSLHKNMHIYTSNKDSSSHGTNNTKSGSSSVISNSTCSSSSSKIPFNKPRSYKCVVCSIAFRVIGHLRKHHKSKTHLQGLVNSGLLSKSLYSKIEQSKVPIQEVIDQKTGNINPDVLSHYITDWSQASAESEPH